MAAQFLLNASSDVLGAAARADAADGDAATTSFLFHLRLAASRAARAAAEAALAAASASRSVPGSNSPGLGEVGDTEIYLGFTCKAQGLRRSFGPKNAFAVPGVRSAPLA